MKLIQTVDHLRAFLALLAAHRSSRQITWKKLPGWLNMQVSIRDAFIGWGAGDGLAGKDNSSKLW